MRNNKKSPLLLITIWMTISLTGCNEPPPAKPGVAKRQAHLVEIDTVEWKPVSISHERTGSLRSRRLVRIHNQEEGRVIELPHFEGDLVEAGELLISMEDELLKAQLSKARATTNQAYQDLERISNLVDRRAASKDELTRVNTRLEVAQAEQKLLQTRLS